MKLFKILNCNCLKLFIFILISSTSSILQAQNMSIYGNVIDTLNNTSKKNAVVMLVRLSDSVMIDFKRTDDNGGFYFNTPMDTVEIILSHHNNDDKVIFFFPSKDRMSLNLNNTILPEKSEMMNEVTIYAYKDPVFFRGDTLVFLADSFKTKANAVVEDLLKKLPGVEVDKNGSITSQGREVNKVLVDGDEFFGSDPTIATKNLGAKSIESVEIYEEENTDSDETADETIQVMDLKLKEDAKKGYFGRVSGGTDFNDFYEGELLFNKFNKDFKLSVFSLASNTPRANFGYGDIKKYGLSTDNGNFFSDGNRGWWVGNDGYDNSGIPETIKSGVFFSDKIGDKVKLGMNYTYNQSSLVAKSERNLQYLLSDTTFFVEENNESNQKSDDHLINARIEIQLDSATSLEILPSYSFSNSENYNVLRNTFKSEDEDTISNSIVQQDHSSESFNFNTEIRLKREFKKKDRLLKYAFKYSESENDENQLNLTKNGYVNNSTLNDTVDQRQNFYSGSNNYKSQLLFREPLSKKWSVDIEHLYKLNIGNQDRKTNNRNSINGNYDILASEFSNYFDNLKLTNRAGIYSIYRYKKDRIKLGGYVRNVQLRSFDESGDPLTDSLNFWDVLPQVSFRHKFNNSQRLRFNYRTNSRQPSLNQLQPVQNNSNPNKVVQGNPDLRPDYSHQLNLSYNHWKGLTGSYIWSNLSYSRVLNPFSNQVSYDNYGRTISKTINMDSSVNEFSSLNIGGKIPIANSPLGLNIRNFSNYSITNNVIDNLKNTTSTLSQSNEIALEWETDSLFIEIGAEISYSKPTNSLNNIFSQPFITQYFFLDTEIELPWKMTFFSESGYTINTQRADGYNINFLIINFSLEKRFTKNENIILSLEGNDVLNQNIIAQRLIQNNIIIDNKTTIISRYFLLRLTYKFNNNKTKAKDESFH